MFSAVQGVSVQHSFLSLFKITCFVGIKLTADLRIVWLICEFSILCLACFDTSQEFWDLYVLLGSLLRARSEYTTLSRTNSAATELKRNLLRKQLLGFKKSGSLTTLLDYVLAECSCDAAINMVALILVPRT